MKNKPQAVLVAPIVMVALVALATPRPSHAAATITVVNGDDAGKGFNDPTSTAPVGGNAGITVGQQRLIAFSYAALKWQAALDGTVAISIKSSFSDALPCLPTRGVLGSTAPWSAFAADFPPPARSNVWYVSALASQLSGRDVDPGNPAVVATFNAQLGTPNCLTNTGWYYGLDGNTSASQFDLIDVVLHEFAHGLGFLSLANQNGQWLPPAGQTQGLPDIWEFTMFDLTARKHWSEMVDQERAASAVRPRQLVWDGANARSAVPNFLVSGTPTLTVTAPQSLAREYLVGEALFGPPLTQQGVTGNLTAPLDGGGSTQGCSAFGSTISGIALIDRGNCNFTDKVKNAQQAGAIAVVIAMSANDVPGSPPPTMGGTDSTITVPSVLISQADGMLLRNAIPQGVTVNEHLLPARRGADGQDDPMLYTPAPYLVGSSVSHTDPSALLLMDPAYNTRLGHKLDLTPYFFKDIGWSVSNPDPADLSADIAIAVSGPSNYQKDANVLYRVTVSNKGPSDAPNVLLFSIAPDPITFASSSGPCTGFPCSLGPITAGTNRAFTISLHVPPSYSDGDLKVTLNAAPPFPDPVVGNNAASINSSLGTGGCSSTGPSEPMLVAALLLLAALPRRSRPQA